MNENYRMDEIVQAQIEENKVRQEDDSDNIDHDEQENTVKETPKDLKVKADPKGVSSEERKRNVKKLAGAISHSLRAAGEINVRSFGNAAIAKAAKSIAIARGYVKTTNLKLDCAPAFITMKMGENDLTGICFVSFASERDENDKSCDRNLDEVSSVLMVKADSQDVSSEERKRTVKKLAGAISHSLEENHEVVVRCFGNATIGKAAKAIAIARGYTATRGPDLYCWPQFIVANINGNERTGIAFYCYTNEL